MKLCTTYLRIFLNYELFVKTLLAVIDYWKITIKHNIFKIVLYTIKLNIGTTNKFKINRSIT